RGRSRRTAMTTPRDDAGLRPVTFSRLSTRGVLLGLSTAQLAVVAVAAATFVATLYLGGDALLYAVPVVGVCAGLVWVKVAGRPLVEWLPLLARWQQRATTGQLDYRARIGKPRPAGTLALPGDAARMRQWIDAETGSVYVHDPHANTLAAVLEVSHSAFVLLDPAEQNRRTTGWSRVLATACRSGRIGYLQVLERTLP